MQNLQAGTAILLAALLDALTTVQTKAPCPLQMAVAKAEHQQGIFKGPVVVLADRDKAEMDAAVAEGLQGPVNLEVKLAPQM